MPDLTFQILSAEPQEGALAPHLRFKLLIQESTGSPIQTITLRCQVHIDATQRRYSRNEQDRLIALFGTPDRWGKTLRSLLWTQVNAVIGPFSGTTTEELLIPCTHDFCLAVTRYFDALADGEAPVRWLFGGSIFYEASGGRLQVIPISWDKESLFRLPVATWHELMRRYHAGSVWFRLGQDVFNRLMRFSNRSGFSTWDEALDELLARQEAKENQAVLPANSNA